MAATPNPLSPRAVNIEEGNAGADDDDIDFDATMGGDQATKAALDVNEEETGAGDDDGDDSEAAEEIALEGGSLNEADDDDDVGNAGDESANPNGNGDDDEDDDMPPPPQPFTCFPSPTRHPPASPQTHVPTPILPPSPLLTHTSPIFLSSPPAAIHHLTPTFPPSFTTPIQDTAPMVESSIRDNEATLVPSPQLSSIPTTIPPYPITFTRRRKRDQRRAPSPINEEPSNDHHTPSPVSSPRSVLPLRNLLLEFNPSPPPPPPQEDFTNWREELRASFDFIFQNYH